MAITDDLVKFEQQLGTLVTRYEQYFIGLEKREPLPLLNEVENLVRHISNYTIRNTMYKHKYSMLVARFNTYREHWTRIVRLIDEGKYSRNRFISDLHQRQRKADTLPQPEPYSGIPQRRIDNEDFEGIYRQYLDARRSCNLPVEKISREILLAGIEKKKPLLAQKLGSDDLVYRVVIQNGSPKIKASVRKG
ncbi:MAG: hypothetical protein A2079_04135 [Geobacteraceae bacterium GWC2_48_7]|nr:MAG: hypothetical protein A2079_04135 [Geobacteraceae bacterium GWC2_48_7]